ncbi:hypothetical protein R6V09_23400 [Streptomyces sp. W16]|uniref:hypothetical protein n=1 Tax=Streptomyces sp. W16 TaxID=3076631 RepID=UPI00295AF63B|nr:hypothetical protein [Streptomyces sp. W16]MDV9173049.1 hypothetical protein [Streptomyces sp. W16]
MYRLTIDDFTDEDVAEFHRLMSELLTKCASVGEQHAPEGTWAPSTDGLFDQMAESMQLVAEVSRALNHTRAGIRRVGGRARQRLYDRVSGHEGPAGMT